MATAKAGHVAIIKVYDLDDVAALTAEPMTDLTGNVFQITDATKRVFDPAATFTADDGAPVPIVAGGVDHLFGRVTLDGSQVPPVTLTGSFVPITANLSDHAMSLTLARSRVVLDQTQFSDNDIKRLLGLKDASMQFKFHGEGGNLENIENWNAKLEGDDNLLIEVDWSFVGKVFRGWFQVPDWSTNLPVDALVELGFTLVSRPLTNVQDGGDVTLAFGTV